jgi:oligo-1,6-glucosidase
VHELNAEVISGHGKALLTVGEMPGATVDDALLFTDPARREVDMVFQFEHVQVDQGPGGRWDVQPLRLVDLKASFGRWQAGLAEKGWNSLYWNNHDQPRAVSRFGSDEPAHRVLSAKLLGTILHLHRGTPYVYQGEELGMTNVPFASIEEFRDIESVNHYRQAVESGMGEERMLAALRHVSRDNARTPMHWDGTEHAGFSTGTPWLPVNPNHHEINAAVQVDDPESVFNHYRRLVALRHEVPAVVHGAFRMLLPNDEQVYAFTRALDDVELLVVGNFSSAEASAELSDAEEWGGAELLISNYPDIAPATSGGLTLRPWETRVHRRLR